ncbi:MAG: hypothetical protein DIU65_17065 [Proteobacteria bacterium]|jgi:hypothetical protein|nr:MAG: hypothetical protein DIU65_17065 [Pseudomonadota bacterium]
MMPGVTDAPNAAGTFTWCACIHIVRPLSAQRDEQASEITEQKSLKRQMLGHLPLHVVQNAMVQNL